MLTDLLLTAESVGTDLIALDKEWLLAVNGSDSLFLDRVAHVLTTALTWLPLYLSLLYIVIRNNENFRKVLCVLAGAGLCVLLAGSVDDLIVKPTVARWRPRRWLSWRELRLLLCPCGQHVQHRHLLLLAHPQSPALHSSCYLVAHQLLDTYVSGCPLPW